MQEIINLLYQDLTNEYAHMHFYLWASSVVGGLHREELSEFFKDAAKSEMEHISEFTHILLGLGCFQPPVYNPLPKIEAWSGEEKCPNKLLKYAIAMEEEVVKNYYNRIKQITAIDSSMCKFLEIFLEDQLLDSQNDAIHMSMMLKK